MPLRHAAYVLQGPFKKNLERLQEHQILAPLAVDKMGELSNGFITVPKPNDAVCLFLDPVRPDQELIKPKEMAIIK